MATESQHDEYLSDLADAHERRMLEALERVEQRIADYLDNVPTQAGKLFDTEWAVSARREIQQIIESEYNGTVQSLLEEYSDVAVRSLEMLNNYGDFTGTSREVINQLQRLTFQGFEDIGRTYLDTIADQVYQNALTGRSKADMIKSIRQTINGVYMQSDQAEINKLVDIAKNGSPAQSKAAIEKLHTVYAADRTGNNMRRYATQITQDSLMQFDSSINVRAGIEAGATKWKYYGDVIRDSRQFCRDRVGNVYTNEEIEEIWQGSWKGKSSSDAFIARGGYNCRHHWRPVLDSEPASTAPRTKADIPTEAAFELEPKWDKLAKSRGGISPAAGVVINKLAKPKSITSKGGRGYYVPGTAEIVTPSTGLTGKRVLMHEYGHHIDYTLGPEKGVAISASRLRGPAKADAESLGVFLQRGLGKAEKFDGDSVLESFRDQWYTKEAVYYKRGSRKGQLRGYQYVEKYDWVPAMSDILDSMSRGRFQNKFYGFGHGVGYYSRGEASQMTENFANLFQLWSFGGEGWEKAKELFPRLTKEFEELMDGVP